MHNLLTHISLLASSHAKQQDKITRIEDENDTLKRKQENLEADNRLLKTKITELVLKTAPPIVNSMPLGAPVLTMTNFQQRKRDLDNNYWLSPPVYTHHQGYKICLRVDASGWGTGKGTHVSVYVYFMRGEFDDSLKWPFRGVISYQLLNQVNGKDHKTGTTTYDDKTPNMFCTRVTKGESSHGQGYIQFIAHTQLEPKYLQNDTLLFQIHKVELKLVA